MPSVVYRIASTFSCVHKATGFCIFGLLASGFIAVKALNCGFVGLLRKARVLMLWFAFSFLSNLSQRKVSRNKSLKHQSLRSLDSF